VTTRLKIGAAFGIVAVLACLMTPRPPAAATTTSSRVGTARSTEVLTLQIVRGQLMHVLRGHTSPRFIPPRPPLRPSTPWKQPPPPPIPSATISEAAWLALPGTECIKQAESGGNYSEGGDEPYGGAWQFSVGTWWSVGMTGYPNQQPPAVQDEGAYRLYLRDGYSQWETAPGCGV
jgi:hypothetical protein